MPITSKVQTIEPTLARNWLKKFNNSNRRLRPSRVEDLAEAILRGEWQLDGSPIRFDEDDQLLDGQHRLAAIDRAQVAVPCLIVRGLPRSTQEVMDRTLARTYADKLSIDREPNATHLASAANVMWRYEHAAFGKAGFGRRPSFGQLDDILNRHVELRRSVAAAAHYTKKIKMPRSYLAAARTIFMGFSEEDTDRFFTELRTGEDLSRLDPIFRLREALNANAMSKSKRYSSDHLLALLFKAWNLYRSGEECRNLSFRAGGAAPEAFPIPE